MPTVVKIVHAAEVRADTLSTCTKLTVAWNVSSAIDSTLSLLRCLGVLQIDLC